MTRATIAATHGKFDDEDDDFAAAIEAATPGDGRPMVDTDAGKKMRVPAADIYPGEPPYAAPVAGFHGKASQVFDAFVYLHAGQGAAERPASFLPVVGLTGDDPAKDADSQWKLYGRLRPEIRAQVGESPGTVLMASGMRAENIALLSIHRPHEFMAPSVWVAALPITVLKVPMPTLSEGDLQAMVRAERALEQVQGVLHRASNSKQRRPAEQLSLGL